MQAVHGAQSVGYWVSQYAPMVLLPLAPYLKRLADDIHDLAAALTTLAKKVGSDEVDVEMKPTGSKS